jgi:succinate dehydrogenase / fumarate reductase flavoprotein subunit
MRIGVHTDLSGFAGLAHAFDLKASLLAARATVESALERKESRGAHNRSDYPDLDPDLQVNLVWSANGKISQETIPPIPKEIADLMSNVSQEGKLLE